MASSRKLNPHHRGPTSPVFSLWLLSLILVHRTRVSLPTRELSRGKSSTLYTVSSRGSEATCLSSASSAFFTPARREPAQKLPETSRGTPGMGSAPPCPPSTSSPSLHCQSGVSALGFAAGTTSSQPGLSFQCLSALGFAAATTSPSLG